MASDIKPPFLKGAKLNNLKCIDVSYMGYGVLKYNDFTIFTRNTITDEVVDEIVSKVYKNYAIAKLDKVIKKSKYRVEPLDCNYLELNNTRYLTVDYKHQIEIKKKQLKKLFGYDIEILKADNQYYYRNKSEFFYFNKSLNKYNEDNELIPINECIITDKRINKLLPIVLEALNNNTRANISSVIFRVSDLNNEIMIIFVSKDINKYQQRVSNEIVGYSKDVSSIILNIGKSDNYLFNDKEIILHNKDYIMDTIKNKQFKVSSKSFYQVNNKQTEKLYQSVLDLGDFNKDDNVADLYCGVGTIGIILSDYVNYVVGVEVLKAAVDLAVDNINLNEVNNIEIINHDLNENIEILDNINKVVVDPPRSGLSNTLINNIIKSNIKDIIYVSCNPKTLKRDLDIFTSNGYKVLNHVAVDMFVNTHHVESCVRLSQIHIK